MAVILNTSLGDIVIDLHTDLCPLTSKNFLKLCKLKYYNNCLFHDVKKDFIAQTGDPNGTGSGGDSLYKLLYGDQARFFNDEIHPKLTHDKIGTVAMASAGENLNASQFYITLRAGLDYLDGKHTVFGEVAEGLDTLMRINEAYVDDKGRPYKNIRIKHVDILDDPFDDPPQLEELIPDKSPEIKPPAEGEEVRLEDDWVPMDQQMDAEELDKSLRRKEAHSRAVVLEMIGDIPEAEMAPPENVLFVCKLNPVTEEDDLKIIFSRFGKIIAADIIRDYKTGDSLCYGFIEFENKEACEAAYFKMDNVLIDDRRIHVDFSQSVSKLWTRFRKFGAKDSDGQGGGRSEAKGGGCFNCGEYGHLKKDCPHAATGSRELDVAPVEKPKYTLKESGGQRGSPRNRYDMVFEDDEASHPDQAKVSGKAKTSYSMSKMPPRRPSEDYNDGRRVRAPFAPKEEQDDSSHRRGRNERPGDRYAKERAVSDEDSPRGSRRSSKLQSEGNLDEKTARAVFPQKEVLDDRIYRSGRNGRHGDRYAEDRASSEEYNPRKSGKPSKRSLEGNDDEKRARARLASREGQNNRSYHSGRSERPKDRYAEDRTASNEANQRRSGPALSARDRSDEGRDHSKNSGRPRERAFNDKPGWPTLSSKDRSSDTRDRSLLSSKDEIERHRERKVDDRIDYDDHQERAFSPLSREGRHDGRERSKRKGRSRERNSDDRSHAEHKQVKK